MRPISLHDTRRGERVELVPRDPGRVGIYACGPTVYGRIHVGNARPYVVFSQLKRFLAHEGYDVTFVCNVTDVNDKIYEAADKAGVPSADLAGEMTAHYFADTERLGLGRPDHEPLAAETIDAIVVLIGDLVARGHAYAAEGDVYFSVASYPQYGEISHRDLEEMDQGEGGEGSDRKRDPRDFALWKGQKEGEDTAWDAPWGRGRPGWHIECSAMAEEYLGVDFEVHGGGSDLVFPHHENEAAQTAAARGCQLARIWMHNGMITVPRDEPGEAGDKMAKSVGNIFGLAQALDTYGRDALLLYFSRGHYRQPLAFSHESMADASAAVQRIREAGRRVVPGPPPPDLEPLRERFFDALAQDFNTAEAMAVVFEAIREVNRRWEGGEPTGGDDLRSMLGVLGLANLLDAGEDGAAPPPEALALLERREAARAARDFAVADALRDELAAAGWEVRDGPGGAELVSRAPAA